MLNTIALAPLAQPRGRPRTTTRSPTTTPTTASPPPHRNLTMASCSSTTLAIPRKSWPDTHAWAAAKTDSGTDQLHTAVGLCRPTSADPNPASRHRHVAYLRISTRPGLPHAQLQKAIAPLLALATPVFTPSAPHRSWDFNP